MIMYLYTYLYTSQDTSRISVERGTHWSMLVAIKDDSDDSSDSSDGHHKKIKAQQRKIKEAKAQSAKQRKALENASKKHKKLA